MCFHTQRKFMAGKFLREVVRVFVTGRDYASLSTCHSMLYPDLQLKKEIKI